MTVSPSATVADDAVVGIEYAPDTDPPLVSENCVIRTGTVVYNDVALASGVQTGHHALIREETTVGPETVIGSHVVIDGATNIGSNVSMQTSVYVPRRTEIDDSVFLGPQATLLNDPYPVRQDRTMAGPTLKANVSVGGNATILPGVTVGKRSFVAAGAIVTEDIPPDTLAIGAPARQRPLPAKLQGGNEL